MIAFCESKFTTLLIITFSSTTWNIFMPRQTQSPKLRVCERQSLQMNCLFTSPLLWLRSKSWMFTMIVATRTSNTTSRSALKRASPGKLAARQCGTVLTTQICNPVPPSNNSGEWSLYSKIMDGFQGLGVITPTVCLHGCQAADKAKRVLEALQVQEVSTDWRSSGLHFLHKIRARSKHFRKCQTQARVQSLVFSQFPMT